MTKVSCSILSSELKASDIVKELNKTNVDYIHLDIMDGKFVKNKTWTYGEMKKILSSTTKKLDVHLMVKNPSKYLDDYGVLNTEFITFHYEACNDTKEMIDLIRSYGLKVGVSINPKTNIKVLFPYLKDIDLVLIMSVVPGKSGQTFIEKTLDKIEKLKEEIVKQSTNTLIEVDGGINDITGKLCVEKGADILVSASYIHNDIKHNIELLKSL